MTKALLEDGKHCSKKARHALTAVAAAISLLAALPAPVSAQTSPPCDDDDVVVQTNDALRADCRALWAFYNRLSDPGTLDDAGYGQWGASNSIFAWSGLLVGAKGGDTVARVRELDLTNFGLQGSISAEIGKLTQLEKLNLSYNSLSGSIPAAIGKLTKLRELELGDNNLRGRIPTDIGKLTNLERLQLRDNDLSGSIPAAIGKLTNVEYLNVSDNRLSGRIPTDIGKLTKLRYLNLSRNIGVRGSIPSAIGSLTNLEDLNLSYMNLSGSLPTTMGNLTNLENLYLQYNRLRMNVLPGSIPAALSSLNLAYLNLDNNIFLNPPPPPPPPPPPTDENGDDGEVDDGDEDGDDGGDDGDDDGEDDGDDDGEDDGDDDGEDDGDDDGEDDEGEDDGTGPVTNVDDGEGGDGEGDRVRIGPGRYRDSEGRVFIGPGGDSGIGPVAEVGEIDDDSEPDSGPGEDAEPVGRFADDDRSVHQANIEVIADRGITLGCDPTHLDRFCPNREVTRAQMMAFLARALGESGSQAASSFSDVADDAWYLPYLARLAELGVAEADSDGAFRPLDPLTRADMAVLLTRAFPHITAVAEPTGVFDDVPADAPYAGEVEATFAAGVTRGCSSQPSLYCPDNTVTRAQMASFLARALEDTP